MTELLSLICFLSNVPLNRLLSLSAKTVLLFPGRFEIISCLKRLAAMDAAIMPAFTAGGVLTPPCVLPAAPPGKSSVPSVKNATPTVLILFHNPVPGWINLLMSATAARTNKSVL